MENQKNSLIAKILEFAGEKKYYFIISVILSVFSVVCGIIPYFMIGNMTGKLINGERSVFYFLVRVCFLVLLWILNAVFFGLSTYSSHKGTFAVLASIRRQLTNKMAKLPLGEVMKKGPGEYKSIILERVDGMESILAHIIPEVFGNIAGAIVVMVSMMIIDWRMGLASLAVIPVAFIFMAHMMAGSEKMYPPVMEKAARLNKESVEYIGGIEVIKVYGREKQSYSKYVDAAKEASDGFIGMMRKFNLDQNMSFALLPSAFLVLLPTGIILMMNGSLSLTKFVLLCMLSLGEMQPLLNAFSYMDDIRMAQTTVGAVTDILDAPEMKRPEKTTSDISACGISFDHVSFSYDNTEVLHDVSFTIEPGTVNAFVGPSGSGKSTITKLMASFYDPDSGTIRIGDTDLREISLSDCSKKIAYVSQDNYLFDMTVIENIMLGSKGASREDAVSAAKVCGIHDFIEALPNGYDTLVGEGGGHLSGGERQRITIARAMLKNADIIILDEASSYSDPENEALVQESLSRLLRGKTVIVVAHRLSTISDADRIFLVKQGRIEASGKQDELLETSPLYKKMWQAHTGVSEKEGEIV